MDTTPAVPDAQGAMVALMTEFFMDYLRSLYREFDGDFALLMTLGEIGQANLKHYMRPTAVNRRDLTDLMTRGTTIDEMSGCSALAAAMASGVPRETARRKVLELEARGWITRGADGQWYATEEARIHFNRSFHPQTVSRLLETADKMRAVIARAESVQDTAGPGHAGFARAG